MILIRYILQSLNVLNGLLLAAVAAVVYFAVLPVLDPAARTPLPPVQELQALSAKTEEPTRSLAPRDYAVISDHNLFHPERRIPQEKPPEKAVPKPDVLLYGTMITGEGSFAFVEDRKAPVPAGERDKRQRTLRKGATLGGYTLSEVEADRIVLVKGDDRIVVMLSDAGKRRAADFPPLPVKAGAPSGVPAPSAKPGATLPQPAAPPGPGAVPSRPVPAPVPPSTPQTPSPQGPGIGASGKWPPTRSSVEQTRQRLQEAQQMRMEQILKNQNK